MESQTGAGYEAVEGVGAVLEALEPVADKFTRGAGSRLADLAMTFKLIESA